MTSENNASSKALTINAEIILTGEQFEELEKLAAMGWILPKIAMYFGISKSDFEYAYNNGILEPGSVRYHYDRGIIISTAKIDLALTDSAARGNVTAVQILDKKNKEKSIKKFKEDLLDGNR